MLGRAEPDPALDRILRAQFWVPSAKQAGDVIALAAFRASRAGSSR